MKELQQNKALKEFFSEPKKLIALYNTLSGNQYQPDTMVEILSLPNVLVSEENSFFPFMKNSIDFIIDNKLVIIIEQSTIDENILRYLVDYLLFLINTVINKGIDVFAEGENIINLPHPELYVLYNGEEAFPDEKELDLSDAYESYSSPFFSDYIASSNVKVVNISNIVQLL